MPSIPEVEGNEAKVPPFKADSRSLLVSLSLLMKNPVAG